MIEFDPIHIDGWSDTPVEIHVSPFQWDQVRISLIRDAQIEGWPHIRQLLLDSLHEDNASTGLSQAIHSVSSFSISDAECAFTVDFGTHTVSFLTEIPDLAYLLFCHTVRIGSVDSPSDGSVVEGG